MSAWISSDTTTRSCRIAKSATSSSSAPVKARPVGLRMAEYQHAQARIRGGLIGAQIEHPPRAVIAHRVSDQAAARILDGAHEGRVGGKLQQDCVARFAERHDRGEAGP